MHECTLQTDQIHSVIDDYLLQALPYRLQQARSCNSLLF